MANDISGRPWVLDTASFATVKAGLALVKAIVFSGYATANDQAVLTFVDGLGVTRTLVTLQGTTDLGPVSFNEGGELWLRNIAIPTLTSGQVSVFV